MKNQENDLIIQAKKALRDGDSAKARQLAQESVQKFPDDVEAWLILAGLSSASARQEFLQQAEMLAPDDFRVQQAIQWATQANAHNTIENKTSSDGEGRLLSESDKSQKQDVSQDISLAVCPYLGLKNDPRSSVAYPSKQNVCYRVKPVEAPTLSHQSAYCLGQKHQRCKIFKGPPDNKMPQDIRLSERTTTDLKKVIVRGFLIGFILTVLIWGFFYREEVIADVSRFIASLGQPLGQRTAPQPQPIQATFTQTMTSTIPPTLTATGTALPTATVTPRPPTPTSQPPTSTREKPILALETPIGRDPQFIIHEVIPGESLELYAKQYNTSVAAIRAVNYRLPSFLPLNWVVVIPLETDDVESIPAFEPYEVKEEISVESLSEQLNANLTEVNLYNNIDSNMLLLPGDWLLIPREAQP